MVPILATARAATYAPEAIEPALDRLLAPWRGLADLVRPGMTVLLKPNLLSARSPEQAATTHPAVVRGIARRCRELGARVEIGDSPALILEQGIEAYWRATGMEEVAGETGARLVGFEAGRRRIVSLPAWPEVPSVHVTERYFGADLTINLGKLKTHHLTRITGAIKNHFGLLPGVQKAQLHRRVPRPTRFCRLLLDIWRAAPMRLHLLDGVVAMDGNGPAGGRPVPAGWLLAASDAGLLDLAVCELIGLDPATVPLLAEAQRQGWAPASLAVAGGERHGPDPAAEPLVGFEVPPPTRLEFMPDALWRVARRLAWLRPQVVPDRCIRCGRCVEICPAGAMALVGGDPGSGGAAVARLRIHPRRCIGCFCCLEACPVDALTVATSPLLRLALLLRRWRRGRLSA